MKRRRSGEAAVFSVAVALTLVHALDDAIVHRGPGLGLGQHALAGLIAIAAGVAAAPGWVMFSTMRVLSGDPPGPPLEDLIAEVESPTLLISAGTDVEREFNVLSDEAAGGRVEHWNLPDAHHTDAIHEHPVDYERRVVGFFSEALR